MTRLSIVPDDQEAVEVDLWGTIYKVVPVTRVRQRKLSDLQSALDARIEADPTGNADDEAVQLMADMLGQILEPVDGEVESASSLIVAKWEADDLDARWLFSLMERLGEQQPDPT